MERSPFFKPVVTANAILVLVQSITWFILSIICFLYYSEAIYVTTVESTFRSSLETWIYRLYLLKNDFDNSSVGGKLLNISPKEFIVFCSLYFILSIILINTSLIVIYCMRNVKEKQINFWQYCSIITWVLANLSQTLLDLIFFCLLIDDYNYFADQQISFPSMGVIPTAVGVVMTIVARGFILWIINLVMNAITMTMVIREYQKDKDSNKELFSFPPLERRSTLRRSTVMSEDRRPYLSEIAPAHVMTGRSNDSFMSYEQYPNQVSPPPQALYRQPSIARFNPPQQPGGLGGLNRYDNGYGGRPGGGLYGGR